MDGCGYPSTSNIIQHHPSTSIHIQVFYITALEPELDSGLYSSPISGRKRKLVELIEVAEQGKFKQQLWGAEVAELYYNPWA
jgi:hypothetical protein